MFGRLPRPARGPGRRARQYVRQLSPTCPDAARSYPPPNAAQRRRPRPPALDGARRPDAHVEPEPHRRPGGGTHPGRYRAAGPARPDRVRAGGGGRRPPGPQAHRPHPPGRRPRGLAARPRRGHRRAGARARGRGAVHRRPGAPPVRPAGVPAGVSADGRLPRANEADARRRGAPRRRPPGPCRRRPRGRDSRPHDRTHVPLPGADADGDRGGRARRREWPAAGSEPDRDGRPADRIALGAPAGGAGRRRDRVLPRRRRGGRRRRSVAAGRGRARSVAAGQGSGRVFGQTASVKGTLQAGGLRPIEERLAVARGDAPADLVLRGGRVLSVFTREWLEVDVAVFDGHVAGLGRYDGERILDLDGAHVVPGLIDAHVHIESSKLTPEQFARAVLPHGTTAIVADPHEIGNVLGSDGIHWVLDTLDALPLDVFVMAPSCVPASRFESPRQELSVGAIAGLLRRRRVIGVAEMMNFPGVIAGDPGELAKLETGLTDHVDGHAPGVSGGALNAYVGAGIASDHESTTFEEAREKRRLGMAIMLREASNARNLVDLLPLVHEFGPEGLMFCTDDREPDFIEAEGHVNQMLRVAVANGVRPEDALVMASWNAAQFHRLPGLGAIAPGCQADLVVLEDLERFEPRLVLKRGREPEYGTVAVPEWVTRTVRPAPLRPGAFRVAAAEGARVRAIRVIPGQLLTGV